MGLAEIEKRIEAESQSKQYKKLVEDCKRRISDEVGSISVEDLVKDLASLCACQATDALSDWEIEFKLQETLTRIESLKKNALKRI